jgi:hypothetical protein
VQNQSQVPNTAMQNQPQTSSPDMGRLGQMEQYQLANQLSSASSQITSLASQLDAKNSEINEKDISFGKKITAYIVAFIVDVVWGIFIDQIVSVSTGLMSEIIELVFDCLLQFMLFPSILGKGRYQKMNFGLLELVPFLDIIPWYTLNVYLSIKASKNNLKHLYQERDAIKSQIDSQKKLVSQMKSQSASLSSSTSSSPSSGGLSGARVKQSSSGFANIASGGSRSGGNGGAVIIVIVVILFIVAIGSFGVTVIGPRVAYAMSQTTVDAQTDEASESVSYGAKSAVAELIGEFQKSWKKNLQKASGERIEGNQDTQVKEFVGVEWLNPWTPNTKTYNLPQPGDMGSKEPLEISARLHGFGYSNNIQTVVGCNSIRRSKHKVTASTAYDSLIGSTKEVVDLSELPSELSFDQEITCYPDDIVCPEKYFVFLTAVSSGFTTKAELKNAFIDKSYLEEKLKAYSQQNGVSLDGESAVVSAIRSLYPELSDFTGVSMSDKGLIKLVLQTQKMPLIGLDLEDSGKTIKLSINVENMGEGAIEHISSVRLVLPDGFKKADSGTTEGKAINFCKGWSQLVEDERTVLTLDNVGNMKFFELQKGLQKKLPSCHLALTAPDKILINPTEANPTTIIGEIEYEYAVQNKLELDVKSAGKEFTKTSYGCGKSKASDSKTSTTKNISNNTTT